MNWQPSPKPHRGMQRVYAYGMPCTCAHCAVLPHTTGPVRLAIVGNTSLNEWRPTMIVNAVVCLIDDILQQTLNVEQVISGGAEGVDTLAALQARLLGLPVQEFLPKTRRWHDGFKPRNEQIAQACTHLVRIAASDALTYGSGWTRDRARALGKPTFNYIVDVETGQITETFE